MSRIAIDTQITSKTTQVKSNRYDGTIQTVALTDAGGTSFQFQVNNSYVQGISAILLSTEYAGTTGLPIATLVSYQRGSFVVKITNLGTAVLNAAVRVHFKLTHN